MTSKNTIIDGNTDKKTLQSFDDMGIVHFGERLREAMNGESNTSFAKKCGLSDTVIGKYLRGESYPGIDKLPSISTACGKSIEWLLTGQDIAPQDVQKKEMKSNELIEWWQIILKSLNPDELEKAVEVFKEGGKRALLPSAVRPATTKEILRTSDTVPESAPTTSLETMQHKSKKAG